MESRTTVLYSAPELGLQSLASQCRCWKHLAPRLHCSQGSSSRLPTNELLHAIATETRGTIDNFNAAILILQQRSSSEQAAPQEATWSQHRNSMIECLDAAALLITETPGTACLEDIDRTRQEYSRGLAKLQVAEAEGTKLAGNLKRLINKQHTRVDAERVLLFSTRTALRASSIFLLPFMPVLSGFIIFFDTLPMSAAVWLYNRHVVERDKPVLDALTSLQQKANEKMEEVARTKTYIAHAKAMLDRPEHPAVTRLVDVFVRIEQAKRAIERLPSSSRPSPEAAAGSSDSELDPPASMSDIANCLKSVVHALDQPLSLLSGPLGSLDDAQYAVLDALMCTSQRSISRGRFRAYSGAVLKDDVVNYVSLSFKWYSRDFITDINSNK